MLTKTMQDGAFDQAVKGVDAIEHMASPVSPTDTDDPDAYITPALHGTLSILRSALQEGGKIKRIVITSSVGALFGTITAPPRTFTEKDWADESVEKVAKIGRQANPVDKYRASKVLAEKSECNYVFVGVR
jgi:nucleoside-diphosphate-sugar epimerase